MSKQSFVEMLRAIDDAGLDPYEFRLWVHIWRVGVSWESLRTIAQKCNMSVGKAQQARKSLCDKNLLTYREQRGRLGLAAIISETVVYVHDMNSDVHHMNTNVHHMNTNVHDMNTDVHHMNGSVHHMNAILSKQHEVNNSKRNNKKQQQQPARANVIATAAAAPHDSPVMSVLQEYGIALNKTTTPLLEMDADYVRAHLDHASRNNHAPGLAIKRMLDGDPPPRRPTDRDHVYIPADLLDIVNR